MHYKVGKNKKNMKFFAKIRKARKCASSLRAPAKQSQISFQFLVFSFLLDCFRFRLRNDDARFHAFALSCLSKLHATFPIHHVLCLFYFLISLIAVSPARTV
jgi:hypothetical protein